MVPLVHDKLNPVSVLLFGFLIGIFFSSIFSGSAVVLYVALGAIAVLFFLFPKHTTKKETLQFLSILFLLGAGFGVIRFSFSYEQLEITRQTISFGKAISFSGKVTSMPEKSATGASFKMKGLLEGNSTPVSLLVRGPGSGISYGDLVTVSGTIRAPEPFVTPTGSIFDYPGYLMKDHILGIHTATSVKKTKDGSGIIRALYKANAALIANIHRLVSGASGDLTAGVLLGDKTIMKNNRDSFISTSTAHIVALSGYNVSIVTKFFLQLFGSLSLVASLGIASFGILIFVAMTGFQSSAVRAGIMAGLLLYAKSIGREGNIGRAILATAVVMLVLNPFLLVYDISFQLSFLATLGIVYLTPRVTPYLSKVPRKVLRVPLREMLGTTLATQLFVLPFILYQTGVLSLSGPFVNILVLPFVPFLMVFGALVAALGFFPLIGVPVALLASGTASIMLGIIFFFAKIPAGSMVLPIGLPLMIVLYLFIFYFFDPFGWRKKNKTPEIVVTTISGVESSSTIIR